MSRTLRLNILFKKLLLLSADNGAQFYAYVPCQCILRPHQAVRRQCAAAAGRGAHHRQGPRGGITVGPGQNPGKLYSVLNTCEVHVAYNKWPATVAAVGDTIQYVRVKVVAY